MRRQLIFEDSHTLAWWVVFEKKYPDSAVTKNKSDEQTNNQPTNQPTNPKFHAFSPSPRGALSRLVCFSNLRYWANCETLRHPVHVFGESTGVQAGKGTYCNTRVATHGGFGHLRTSGYLTLKHSKHVGLGGPMVFYKHVLRLGKHRLVEFMASILGVQVD